MDKYLTLWQVLDIMNFGEVAVKVDGITGEGRLANGEGYKWIDTGIAVYYDEEDNGILKSLETGGTIIVAKRREQSQGDKFIIMDREVYRKINKL